MIYQPSQNLDSDAQQFLLHHHQILDAQFRAYEYLNRFWFAFAQMLQQNQNFKLKPQIELIPALQLNHPIGLRYYLPLDDEHILKFSLYDVRYQLVANGAFISCAIKMQSQRIGFDLRQTLPNHQLIELLNPVLPNNLIISYQNDENPYLIALPMLLSNFDDDLSNIYQLFSQILKILNGYLSEKIEKTFDDELPILEKNIQIQTPQENYSISKMIFDPIQLDQTNPLKMDDIETNQKDLESIDQITRLPELSQPIHQTTDHENPYIHPQLKDVKNVDVKATYQKIIQPSNISENEEYLPKINTSKFSFVKPILEQENTNQHKLQKLIKALSEIGLEPVKMNPYQKGGMMIWLSDRSYLNLSPDGKMQCEGRMKDKLNHLLEMKNLI